MCSLKIRHILLVTACMLSPLLCAAQAPSTDDHATYLNFAVPGALGTYPMSINASMTVTGYYFTSPTNTGGFLRAADGTITTFSVKNGLQTVPESINDAGQITGFYEGVAGEPHGFLREADGQVITFDPQCSAVFHLSYCMNSVPVSINEYGVIVGNHPLAPLSASAGFTRSRTGAFTSTAYSAEMHGFPTFFTGVNASGGTIGYFSYLDLTRQTTDTASFVLHSSGYVVQFSVPEDQDYTSETTVAESINSEGAIAGWYSVCFYDCADVTSGGFVRSPSGDFTLFNPPGPIVTAPEMPRVFFAGDSLLAPHRLSMNAEGSITGSYTDTYGYPHGFVRNPYGTITAFDPPRGISTTATAINDDGAIAGSYYYGNNTVPEGFVRLPKP